MDIHRLRDEQRRQRHVDVGAVEIEGIAGRDDQADDGALAAGGFHLLHQARQRRFRGGGTDDEQDLVLDVADQCQDREAVIAGDGAEHDQHEHGRRDVEGQDQEGEIGDRADAVAADGEGHRAEGADRGGLHQDRHQLEDRGRERLQEVEHRLAALADHGQRQAEQHREEQHLQDVARGEGADDRLRDDVLQEADDAGVMRLGGVALHRLGIEAGGIDVQAGAGLDQVADDEADDQRQRREAQEIDHRLAGDAPDLLHVGHAGDAGRDRQEDHRRDDHLHQLDEGIAERLQGGALFRPEMAEQDARRDGEQHLHIEMLVKLLRARRLSGRDVDHGRHVLLLGSAVVLVLFETATPLSQPACQSAGIREDKRNQ